MDRVKLSSAKNTSSCYLARILPNRMCVRGGEGL